MNEQEEFFSPKHKQLLNIATWAKYLAWVVLIIYILLSVARYIEIQNIYNFEQGMSGGSLDIIDDMKNDLIYGASVVIDVLSTCLQGIVFFLVLKGISLGLNMIVETDLNYREKGEMGGM